MVSLAKRFPQIGLADANSLDQLREEFLDFKLSPTDFPSLAEYTAADLTKKPSAIEFGTVNHSLPYVHEVQL